MRQLLTSRCGKKTISDENVLKKRLPDYVVKHVLQYLVVTRYFISTHRIDSLKNIRHDHYIYTRNLV